MDIGELLDARFREQAEQIEVLRREIEELKMRRHEVPAEDGSPPLCSWSGTPRGSRAFVSRSRVKLLGPE
jgi:hypothetical protein